MKVKIIKASPSKWYATRIDEVFEVEDKYFISGGMAWYRIDSNNSIEICDCIEVDDEVKDLTPDNGTPALLKLIDEFRNMTDDVKKPRVPDENTPIDTLVRVKDVRDSPWQRRYFAKIKDGKIWCFDGGTTSKTYNSQSTWKYVEII